MQTQKYMVEMVLPADMDSSDVLARLQDFARECLDECGEPTEYQLSKVEDAVSVQQSGGWERLPPARQIPTLPAAGYISKR